MATVTAILFKNLYYDFFGVAWEGCLCSGVKKRDGSGPGDGLGGGAGGGGRRGGETAQQKSRNEGRKGGRAHAWFQACKTQSLRTPPKAQLLLNARSRTNAQSICGCAGFLGAQLGRPGSRLGHLDKLRNVKSLVSCFFFPEIDRAWEAKSRSQTCPYQHDHRRKHVPDPCVMSVALVRCRAGRSVLQGT